jgi:hypothetical protein
VGVFVYSKREQQKELAKKTEAEHRYKSAHSKNITDAGFSRFSSPALALASSARV